MSMPNEAELVIDAHADLAEGAIWDSKNALLYWVNINGHEVHVYDPATDTDRAINVGEPVGTVVARASGGVMLALKSGFAHLDLDTEELTRVCDPEGHNPDLRFNDGKCDPAGRFWAGTITGRDKPGIASLFCLSPDLTARQMLTGVTNSNGICWSLDEATMYYIDTPTRTVAAFDYDKTTGEIGNRRVVVEVPEDMGHPDGMTIDAEGMLWVAHWGGWSVNRWDPNTGAHLDAIALPASNVSSCAFGGAGECSCDRSGGHSAPVLDTLYITTAREHLGPGDIEKQPHSGGVFKATPGVRGVPAFEFVG
jgi:sugar lactone lactonase YvrE